MFILIILLAIIIFFILALVFIYNKLIKLRNMIDEAWSGIDVQLKRRYDLIPNLVETVKGYASHEKDTLEKVIQARSGAINAKGVDNKAQAENILTGALKSIFALAESYPDLKANQHFNDLQKTLAEIEDAIQMARRYFNAVVRDYNTLCETFPSVFIANMFNFQKREFFEIDTEERKNVSVKF